ncbi:hypothetical protein OIV83_002310 [Microbotryomycetes sp. JL201]|nr:hypothetical protein OIV83_002310 [Microbotryomycetes sp. JL201]
MAKQDGHGSSYITSEDLAAISLEGDAVTAAAEGDARRRDPASFCATTPAATSGSSERLASSPDLNSAREKRVLFCPLALVLQCAQEGQRDPALVHGKRLDSRGRPRLQVKTYSVDTPNLSNATSRAWKNVCAGFSNSIQPLLSPQSARREYSPERELERTSFARSRAYSDLKDDPNFIPNNNKLSIKLPALSRKCCTPAAASGPSKSCLKSSVLGSSPPNSLPSPSLSTDAGTSASTMSYLDTPPPLASPRQGCFPELSPVESAPQSLMLATSPSRSVGIAIPSQSGKPNEPKQAEVIPLSPCCPDCHHGTELGRSPDHVERWSKAAKRKHRRDSVGADAAVSINTLALDNTSVSCGDDCQEVNDEDAEDHVATDSAFGSVVVDELGKEKGKTARQELSEDKKESEDELVEATYSDEESSSPIEPVEQVKGSVELVPERELVKQSTTMSSHSPTVIAAKSGMSPPEASASMATSRPSSAASPPENEQQRTEEIASDAGAAGRKRKFSLSKARLQGWVENGIKTSMVGAAGSTRAFA